MHHQKENSQEQPERKERQLRTELLEKAKTKFNGVTGEEILFWDILESDFSGHISMANRHKSAYFEKNQALSHFSSIEKGVMKHQKAALAVATGIYVVVVGIAAKLGVSQIAATGLTTLAGLALIYWACRLFATRDQLKLRQHGETWIRHSAARSEYELALMKFLYELPPYAGMGLEKQKRQFQADILDIQQRNQARFEQNMKDLDETSV